MITLLLATRNRHKAQEMRQILGSGHHVLSFNDLPGAPVVQEDAATFEGNAGKKAASLAQWVCHRPPPALQQVLADSAAIYALADDSGLEVDFLRGAPGVHSARFAALDVGGGNSPDSANNAKLLRLLEHVPAAQRTARFRCALAGARLPYSALARKLGPFSEGQMFFCDGVCEGRIASAETGRGGFGYDPLFIPEGETQSFADLGEDVKNKISHRSKALAKLAAVLGLKLRR